MMKLRAEILSLVAQVEAYIDFPDEDIDTETGQILVKRITASNQVVEDLLSTADQGRILREGARADLVLFDTKRAEWRTIFNPVNNLVYNADGRSVHTVLVDGRVVVENHQPKFVDEWDLIQKVQRIGEDLVSRMGISYPSRWPVV